MHSLRSIIFASVAVLALTSCESQTYQDGYAAGEKDGREAGERTGYRSGYADGTLRVIGDDWLPSVGLGICGAIGLIAGVITLSLLWDSTGRLFMGTHRLGVSLWEEFDTWRFKRNYTSQLDAMRQRELAASEARVRIETARLLRAAYRSLSDEDIRLHVEHLIRTTQLVREMQDGIEVSAAACETALAHIETHPHLTSGQKGQLIRHLAQAIPLTA
ncbi:MAG: hypothetical protein JNN17_05680 [Verrucomicrobiaceae bacterium]|nr:hypothetical protein [Verrucomicrobiaceae bacterium]